MWDETKKYLPFILIGSLLFSVIYFSSLPEDERIEENKLMWTDSIQETDGAYQLEYMVKFLDDMGNEITPTEGIGFQIFPNIGVTIPHNVYKIQFWIMECSIQLEKPMDLFQLHSTIHFDLPGVGWTSWSSSNQYYSTSRWERDLLGERVEARLKVPFMQVEGYYTWFQDMAESYGDQQPLNEIRFRFRSSLNAGGGYVIEGGIQRNLPEWRSGTTERIIVVKLA
jgi:hypothetical protein